MPKANAQTTLGLFSEPSYISIGDEYDPPTAKAGRHGGLNIMTQNVKRGTVPQYTNFDRTFRRISEGDACKLSPIKCDSLAFRVELDAYGRSHAWCAGAKMA